MPVNNKLEQWKADYTSSDTNDPGDEAQIGTTLGEEFREVKTVVRKDLSRSMDLAHSYTTLQDMPNPGTGKAYSLYKSVTPAEIANNSDIDRDLLATGLDDTYTINTAATDTQPETYNESLVSKSFEIIGNWGELLFPGTPFAVSNDGFSKFSALNILSATENSTPPVSYQAFGNSTKFTFHPQLVPFPRNDEVCHATTSFQIEINNTTKEMWLEVIRDNSVTWSNAFQSANLKGRRIQIIRMDQGAIPSNLYARSTNYPGDYSEQITERYPNGSVTFVMNGKTRTNTNGERRYYGLYYYQKTLAEEIDGVPAAEAENIFGDATTFSGLEAVYIPSNGAGAVDYLSSYVMRMSNEKFLRDPESSTTVANPDSKYYLIGTQNGNRELNGQKHDSVCFQIAVQNIGENETKTFNFVSNELPQPPGYLSRGAVSAGNDWRASIQCINVEKAPTDFQLTPDIAFPIIEMNQWNSSWSEISDNDRQWNRFTLKFRKPFTARITYEIKIVSPSLNGKTIPEGAVGGS